MSECCHYDEGYDEGYDAGKEAAGGSPVGVADAIRLVARERFLAGADGEADLLERVAMEVERDSRFEDKLDREKQRQADIVSEYARQRKAAA